ncbi:MAG: sulfite oxidase [Thermomicrobiales bacterium]
MDRSGLVIVRAEPFNAETPIAALREPLTATPLHYVRSNFDIPNHDGHLRVGGAVERPLMLTVDALRARPATTVRVTLECAGNGRLEMKPLPVGEPWAGCAVGTAAWTGVPLHTILGQAGPRPEGIEVCFVGADHGPHQDGPDIHFVRSLPLDTARHPGADILVAYAMNGEPLSPEHGAPLRLVAPDWYGMASVKWLARIDVLAMPFEGQFQTRSYVYEWSDRDAEPVTRTRVKALITDPVPGDVVTRGTYTIRGKAWSGTGPVTAVEVNLNGSETWRPACLASPVGRHAWQEWSIDWQPNSVGRHVLRARAVDAAGHRQPDGPRWNRLGYGSNAVQVMVVDVR